MVVLTISRTEYSIKLIINGRKITKVIIDTHYKEKHGDTIDDQLILELVRLIDGERFEPEKRIGP